MNPKDTKPIFPLAHECRESFARYAMAAAMLCNGVETMLEMDIFHQFLPPKLHDQLKALVADFQRVSHGESGD